ncbi:DegV family protein [Jeotgalicoccus sp. S0W5]|uniref:DegV family protein n=1 Tax=Jeotgalicoccus sp. S0W5 TaxID=2527874 RepID=UPI001414CDA1|nr:DegV family protein [Jeotgalicoccus sp. S0W5]
MKIAVLCDSSAYLPQSLREREDVFQVEFTLALPNGEVITESTDEVHLNAFFKTWMQDTKNQPKTSQPSVQDYHRAFRQIIGKGYTTVIGIFLSSKVSGTFQTAEAISEEYRNQLTIHNIDSLGLSVNMEQLIIQLTKMIDEDKPYDTIKEALTWLMTSSCFFAGLEKSDHFIKGGRGKSLKPVAEKSLKTFPVLEYVQDDTPLLRETYRTTKQRNKGLAELALAYSKEFPNHQIQISIGHTLSEHKALKLKAAIQSVLPEQVIQTRLIGTAFCSHLGQGALSLGFMPVFKEVD